MSDGDCSPTTTAPRDLDRLRDLRGRRWHPWLRRGLLAAALAVIAVAMSGAFGQREQVARSAGGAAATIALRAPADLRAGVLWRARIEVTAHRRIEHPEIVLAPGYVAGMQLNTIAPNAIAEHSRDGGLGLTYAPLEPGQRLTVHLQLQVNPMTAGRQDLTVSLRGRGVGPAPVRLPAHVTVHR